ncbi:MULTISPECIES: tail completion protein gp17 [unclassified Sphingomonas]|uniref:tail completion protein gp17 n=1 Tax=unclassified Sphingomonas TaxID=196159 RepID=UPI0009EBED04|nr:MULTISPECIES: DUF3168 domain-containing protein [unclassified Sphingomonas]
MRVELQAAMLAAIGEVAGLAGAFDAPPVRAALPHAVVEEPLIADWGTKDQDGREARATVTIRDAGERPERLRALGDAVEAAVLDIAAELGGGWRVASLVLVRSRVVREGAGRWALISEFRVRGLRAGAAQ